MNDKITALLKQLAEELKSHPELINDHDGNSNFYWFNDILGDDIEIRIMVGGYQDE
ncbi:MAG TPA: hypothetical protein VNG51_27515 [Ktedonobacteraceae bacterium]|nr:hypothetical protein [Ktedonobacteraceae bacterium]